MRDNGNGIQHDPAPLVAGRTMCNLRTGKAKRWRSIPSLHGVSRRYSRPLFSGRYSTIYNHRRQLLLQHCDFDTKYMIVQGSQCHYLTGVDCFGCVTAPLCRSCGLYLVPEQLACTGVKMVGKGPRTKPLYAVQGANVAPLSRRYVPVLESHTVPPRATAPLSRSLTFSVCSPLPPASALE